MSSLSPGERQAMLLLKRMFEQEERLSQLLSRALASGSRNLMDLYCYESVRAESARQEFETICLDRFIQSRK
jgi:hypothetical protein